VQFLQFCIPSHIALRILTLIPPNPYGINDNLAWAYAQDGAFYVAFVYNNLITTTGPSKALYKLIWRWPRSEHIKCFLWKVQKKSLVMNFLWWSRGLADSNLCNLCGDESKSKIHMLRDSFMYREELSLMTWLENSLRWICMNDSILVWIIKTTLIVGGMLYLELGCDTFGKGWNVGFFWVCGRTNLVLSKRNNWWPNLFFRLLRMIETFHIWWGDKNLS